MKKTRDIKFTFFINPEMSAFITRASRRRKLPKSVFLRQLIQEDISKKALP
jgi:hypothetical protein